MKNSQSNGQYISFQKNGEPCEMGYYKNNLKQGIWKEFYDNGQLFSVVNYIDGKRNGYYVDYYIGGNKFSIGTYVNDILEGEYNMYDEDGELISRIFYLDGANVISFDWTIYN